MVFVVKQESIPISVSYSYLLFRSYILYTGTKYPHGNNEEEIFLRPLMYPV